MKKYFKLWVIMIAAGFIFAGCASQKGSKDDYFGYNNSNPKADGKYYEATDEQSVSTSTNQQQQSNKGWVNPLQDNYDNRDNFQVTNSGFNAQPDYVTVVAPWWDVYYPRYYPFSSFYWDPWYGWGYNWYSPWYAFCPLYFSPYDYYYYNYYYSGWHYNYGGGYHGNRSGGWAYNNQRSNRNDIRSFGPSRGSSTSGINKSYFNAATSNSPRSSAAMASSAGNKGIIPMRRSVASNQQATSQRITYKSSNSSASTSRGYSSGRSSYPSYNHSTNSVPSGYGARSSGGGGSYRSSGGGSSSGGGGSRSSGGGGGGRSGKK